ncbi:MAG: alpha/beta fold hydrolase [Solirubrobacteraceae bacterium]|nr:alpha/beta fold hydrolase [Solirubrobacteraceae bacterium]
MRETVILLHGFSGTGRAWEPVVERLAPERYRSIAPDIRGHGLVAGARPVSFAACVADVLALGAGPFTLVGYSMGGRLALHVALAAPERVRRLVLVATTAGIEDEVERAARRASDERLADRVSRESLGAFAERWLTQPMFRDDPPAAQRRAREDILRNEPAGLAAALRGIGTGAMEPLWHRLDELRMPARVLAGERDAKFASLARRLAGALPAAELRLVPGAGHALVREEPAAVAAAIAGGRDRP